MRWTWFVGCAGMLALGGSLAQADTAQGQGRPDPEGQLYVVGTAHLDTQWRWTVRQTIEEFLPATLQRNFELFRKYPDYVFSFEGAFRYLLMKEYYPNEYEHLKEAVSGGRWRVAGSWVDAVDVNIPSPESLMRQALYGNGLFRREFGVTSRDVFLPDCFGFGFALPAIAAHCGLTGFSTQKLTWGSAVGVPFDIGLWEGVDGSTLVAALNPGDYVSNIGGDLSTDSAAVATIEKQAQQSGLRAGYKYFGTGDQGGSPTEESVAWLERSIHGTGPVRVRSVASDQLARDLTAHLTEQQMQRLPHYRGELLMTDHGTGCYTSQAAMKRWNRKNEKLADAAERASVAAHWLGGILYPRETMRGAWIRFLWHQFHDDLTGTSVPEAYVYSWDDEAISQNEFASMLTDAVGAVARGLDTRVRGVPLVVYNPLSIEREDVAEVVVAFKGRTPSAVRVYAPDGREVPSQISREDEQRIRVTFLAAAPPVGFSVYDIRPAVHPCDLETDLSASPTMLENSRYRLRINADGDIASIRDKLQGQELLSAPVQLQLLSDTPRDWAAWEVDYEDLMAQSKAVVGGPARIRVVERGPARAAIEIVRTGGGSTFRQVIRLGAGGTDRRVEIPTQIDWCSPATLLKAAFPLAVSNQKATYDLGLGTIQRGTNRKELYEVPAQQWADLTGADGRYGIAILNDCKYGWDKPDDHTLRLTLVRTPEVNDRWNWIRDQSSMDLGSHRVTYALCGHAGDWREGDVAWQAEELNQPLLVFQTDKRRGPLGRWFSLLQVSTRAVAVRAVKLAEEGDEIVIRMQELRGAAEPDVRVTFARPIVSAREMNGAEERLGPATVQDGALRTTFKPYQPRTFALRLADPPVRLTRPQAEPVKLPYNLVGITPCGTPTHADFDGAGHTLPGDLLPMHFLREGIPFETGPREEGRANVLVCRGQELALPSGGFNRLYLVAGAVNGDREAIFKIDNEPKEFWIQDYEEPIGQWDNRLVGDELRTDRAAIVPAYVKPDPIAWVGTHRHRQDGRNEAYSFAQMFKYRLDLPPRARTLTLPEDDRIRILAITAAHNENDATFPAQMLYDRPTATAVKIHAQRTEFIDSTAVSMSTPNAGASIRYTTDGSDPSPVSTLYRGPIALSATTTVKARAFCPEMDDRFVAAIQVTRRVPREAESPSGVLPGLVCRYYEGQWQKLPRFDTLTPMRSEVWPDVSIPPFARPENYGLVLDGYVRVPSDGMYTFHIWSDDGSALSIGGEAAIDNDGLHGKGEVTASAALKAGLHRIRVSFFQGPGDAALELWMEGPGIPRTPVPAEALFH